MESKIIEMYPQFVTVKQAVKATGLSEHFIRAGVRDRRIPHLMAGTKILVNLTAFVEQLDKESRGAVSG